MAYEDRPNGFNGIKNFPKLLLKLMLNHEYIYDYLTYWTLAAEIYPEKIVDTPYVNFGAAAGSIAALISKGQDLRSKHPYSMENDSVFWVAGRQSEENFKILIEMVRES